MITQILSYSIGNISLLMITGILSLILFLFASIIPVLNRKRILDSVKWHYILSKIAVVLAIIHSLLSIFNYI
jgi:hypothetical protein